MTNPMTRNTIVWGMLLATVLGCKTMPSQTGSPASARSKPSASHAITLPGNSPLVVLFTEKDPVSIYVEGIGFTDQECLKSLNTKSIQRIEFMEGAAAVTFYGPKAHNGYLQVFMLKGAPLYKDGETKCQLIESSQR